jgi:hypothetical protein
MSELADLYAVQLSDIAIAQAKHRLSHLPEMLALASAKSDVASITMSLNEIGKRAESAKNEIAEIEKIAHVNDASIVRFNKQLKTVIAPREAEALQHEIATCAQERSVLDDRELELMELVDLCDRETQQVTAQLHSAAATLADAERDFAAARNSVQGELDQFVGERSAQVLVVPASLLSIYEAKRKHRPDGAIAKLHGPTCGACHLDIAQGEIAALRAYPAGERPECPHCGSFILF